MPVRVKITMSPEEYLRHMKEVEAATVQTAATMQNKFLDVGTSINKAGIATRFVSSEMGALGVAIGRVFQVAGGGKLAIAVAAIAAAFTGLKKLINELTLSEEEYNQKLSLTEKMQQRRVDIVEKQKSEEKGLIDRLTELSEREDKTNEEQTEAARLTEILAERYNKLGLKVNKATGEFENFNAAIAKINEQSRQDRIASLEKQLSINKKMVDAQFKDAYDPGFSLFGFKLSEKMFDDRMRSMSLGEKRDWAKREFDKSKTTDDLNKWAGVIELIDRQIEAEKELNSLRKTGFENAKQEAEVAKQNSEESRKAKQAQEEADAAAVAELEKYAQEQEEIDRKHGEALQRQFEQEKKITDGIKQRRFDQIANLKLSAMRATGNTEEAAIRSAWYDESKAQGRPLDDTTKRQIAEMVRAQLALDNAMNTASTAPMDYAPRVNSLIARGGSAQAVKMPSLEDIQKRTLNQLEDITKIVRYINERVGDWGKVTNV